MRSKLKESDEEIEESYCQIQEVMQSLKKLCVNIIMSDFKVKVGVKEVPRGVVGNFGIGSSN